MEMASHKTTGGGTAEQEQQLEEFPPLPDTANVLETERWIDIIRHKYIPYRFHYTEKKDPEIPPELTNQLKTFLEQGKASYFLEGRLTELLTDLEDNVHRGGENDSLPYEIAPGVFGSYVDGRGLYITHSKESFEDINAWLVSAGQTEEVYKEREAELARLAALPDDEGDPDGNIEDHYMTQDAMAEYSFQESVLPKHFRPLQPSDLVFSQNEDGAIDLADLATLHTGGMLWNVKNDFGIELKEVSLPIQYNFLQFLKQKTKAEALPVQEFTKKFKTPGLTAFLANEQDQNWGERIIALGNRLDAERGALLFSKFSELVNASAELAPLMAELLKTETTKNENFVPRIYTHLLERATVLLQTAEKRIEAGDIETLVRDLENTKGEIILFAATCREAKKEGQLDLREVLQSLVERKSGNNLEEKEYIDMANIFSRTRSRYDETTRAVLDEEFEQALNDPAQDFYLLKIHDQVVAFVRFTDTGHSTRYVGAFSMDPSIQGYSLGTAFFDTILDDEASRAAIEAISATDQPLLKHYIEKNHFVITGKTMRGTREYFTLLRDDQALAQQFEQLAA